MKIATNYKVKLNKPKGTTITRIPQGVEDSLFLSYFEGSWKTAEIDIEEGKTAATSTEKNQDISKLAN